MNEDTVDQLRLQIERLEGEIIRIVQVNIQLFADKRKLIEAVSSLSEELCEARALRRE